MRASTVLPVVVMRTARSGSAWTACASAVTEGAAITKRASSRSAYVMSMLNSPGDCSKRAADRSRSVCDANGPVRSTRRAAWA